MEANKIFEMRYDSCNEIADFVFKSINYFYSLNLRKEEIKILMPETVKFLFERHPLALSFPDAKSEIYFKKLFDIEWQPHYKNEIVVYCPQFWRHPDFDCPKILELKHIINEVKK